MGVKSFKLTSFFNDKDLTLLLTYIIIPLNVIVLISYVNTIKMRNLTELYTVISSLSFIIPAPDV